MAEEEQLFDYGGDEGTLAPASRQGAVQTPPGRRGDRAIARPTPRRATEAHAELLVGRVNEVRSPFRMSVPEMTEID